MKKAGRQTVKAMGKAWLRRILVMHMSAASMRTMSAAANPASSRRVRRYLSLLP
jgi:hypothetical protein